MAQLKDLIVLGTARILNKIYAKEVIADDVKVNKSNNETISLASLQQRNILCDYIDLNIEEFPNHGSSTFIIRDQSGKIIGYRFSKADGSLNSILNNSYFTGESKDHIKAGDFFFINTDIYKKGLYLIDNVYRNEDGITTIEIQANPITTFDNIINSAAFHRVDFLNLHNFKLTSGEEIKFHDLSSDYGSKYIRDFVFETKGNLRPYYNNTTSLGTSTLRWKELWLGNATINPSDKKLKKDINYDISDNMIEIFDNIKICSYKWKQNTSGRTHYGIIAQDLKDVIEKHGLTTKEYGAIVIDRVINQDNSPRLFYDIYTGYNNTYKLEVTNEVNPDHEFDKRETITVSTIMDGGISIFTKPQCVITVKTLSHPENFEDEKIPPITIHSITLKSSDEDVEDKSIDLSNKILTSDTNSIQPKHYYNEDGSLTVEFAKFGNAIGIWINPDGSLEDLEMYDTVEIDVTYSDQFAIGANDDPEDIYKEMTDEERRVYAVRWGEIIPIAIKRIQMLTEENKQLKKQLEELSEDVELLKTELNNIKSLLG